VCDDRSNVAGNRQLQEELQQLQQESQKLSAKLQELQNTYQHDLEEADALLPTHQALQTGDTLVAGPTDRAWLLLL
jgi:predicted  nucleic acid-binding Zn-ribbon protein